MESVEYHDVPVAYFVEHGYDASFAEAGVWCCVDAAYVFDEAIVADDAVAQGGATYAAVFVEAFGYVYCFAEGAECYLSVEVCLVYVFCAEIVGHGDVEPVFCRASLLFECVDFVFVQFPHNVIFFLVCVRNANIRKNN